MSSGWFDITDGPCEASVKGGVISEIRRTVRVTDLTNPASEKYLVVVNAMLAVTSVTPMGSSPTGYNNMVFVDLHAAKIPGEQTAVDVEMIYLHRGHPRAQHLYLGIYGAPTNGVYFQWRVGSEIKNENTIYDTYGNIMQTGYTYPDGTTYLNGILVSADPDFQGETKYQTADFQLDRSLVTLTATGVIASAYPDVIVNEWAGYVNSDNWYGYPAGTARCMNVEATQKDIDASPPLWDFTFAFMIDPWGWTKEARFIDTRIGVPPPDIVPGFGSVFYEVYPFRPFSEWFPI